MKYSVVLLPHAEGDLGRIILWLKAHSPQGADTWIRRWLEVLELLESDPMSCGFAPENDDHDAEIRQVIFKTRRGRPYRALFTMKAETVYVLHIRGPGQRTLRRNELEVPGN